MNFVVIYIIFVALIGYWASTVGRNVVLCVLGAILFSPLVVAIYLLIAGKSKNMFKKCPSCAELVKKEAVICKHCNTRFEN